MALEAGTLSVTVNFANNLKNHDFLSKQDPYCILRCGGNTLRTSIAHGAGSSPVWHETFSFSLINENQLELTVMDHDTFTRDDVIGSCSVSLAKARLQGSEVIQAPVMTRKGSHKGFVQLTLKFTSNNSLRNPYSHPQQQQQAAGGSYYAPPQPQPQPGYAAGYPPPAPGPPAMQYSYTMQPAHAGYGAPPPAPLPYSYTMQPPQAHGGYAAPAYANPYAYPQPPQQQPGYGQPMPGGYAAPAPPAYPSGPPAFGTMAPPPAAPGYPVGATGAYPYA